MNMMNEVKGQIHNLEQNYSVEEIFDLFDLEVNDVLLILFKEGLIDPELLEEVCGN